MTDKPNHGHSHHHSHNEAPHHHASGHGEHVAHSHNSWKPEEYEQVNTGVEKYTSFPPSLL